MIYRQRDDSPELEARVETVSYPLVGEGAGAMATYLIDIGGRKRETVGAKLAYRSDHQAGKDT